MTSSGKAVACHVGGFLGSFLLLGNIVATFVLWLVNKEDQFVDRHGKAALNFQLSMTLYVFVLVLAVVAGFFIVEVAAAAADSFVLLVAGLIFGAGGLAMFPILLLVELILVVKASVKAGNGEDYSYPLTIRFVK